MQQYTINMIRFWLGEAIRKIYIGRKKLNCRNGICLLDSSLSCLDGDSLYIGAPELLRQLLDSHVLPEEGAFVITSAGQEIPEPEFCGFTLIQTDLPLTTLYNRLHLHVHRYSNWTARLQQAVSENLGIQDLLTIASEELEATMLVTNPGYRHVAAWYHPEIQDDMTRELQDNGYHSYEMIQQIHKEKPVAANENGSTMEYISSSIGFYNIIHLIRNRGTLAARLCVMLPGPQPDPYYRDLAKVLAEYVSKAMLYSQGADYTNNAALGSMVADLIEARLYTPEELDQRLKQVQLSLRKHYHLVLVQINDLDDQGLFPWNYIMSQIQQAFSHCDVTTYRGDILLLLRKTQRGSRPDFRRELLQQILERFGGRAMISNASQHLLSLAVLYNQVKGVMRIATQMDPQRRIYYFEEYSVFQVIEMAADSELNSLGSRNLMHLCNNELIALVVYDKKHGTDYTDILYTYLLYERNMTLSASVLFLHRNTLLYKINKIKEIIGCDLEEPMLRERLLFSYRVLQYIRRYQGDDILKLKRPSE